MRALSLLIATASAAQLRAHTQTKTVKTALVVIDVQNDFCEGVTEDGVEVTPKGSLAVTGCNAIVPKINQLRSKYDVVVQSADWHPKLHTSFQSNTPQYGLFSVRDGTKPDDRRYGQLADGQMLWPDHCVQESDGAKFHPKLTVGDNDIIIHKGQMAAVESYSAVGSLPIADGPQAGLRFENTGLDLDLQALGVTNVDVVGLAYDFCVAASAVDLKKSGFFNSVRVLKDATGSVGLPGTVEKAEDDMAAAGVVVDRTKILVPLPPPPKALRPLPPLESGQEGGLCDGQPCMA